MAEQIIPHLFHLAWRPIHLHQFQTSGQRSVYGSVAAKRKSSEWGVGRCENPSNALSGVWTGVKSPSDAMSEVRQV